MIRIKNIYLLLIVIPAKVRVQVHHIVVAEIIIIE